MDSEIRIKASRPAKDVKVEEIGVPINLTQLRILREVIKSQIDPEHCAHERVDWNDLLQSTDYAIERTCQCCGRATGASVRRDAVDVPTCLSCCYGKDIT